MGRPRRSRPDLPQRVYSRCGRLYYVDVPGKWHALCADDGNRSALFEALAKLHAAPQRSAMEDLLDRWERDVLPRKSERTGQAYGRQLRILRCMLVQFTHPKQITPPIVAQILDGYGAPVMANRLVALLSTIMTSAVRWGLAPSNPCLGVSRNKERPAGVLVTDEQFTRVAKRASREVADAMWLAYRTGQRQGDLLSLRWTQIDWDAGRIYWRQSKTGTELHQVMSAELRTLLQELRARPVIGMTVLLTSRGKPWTSSGFQTAWRRLRAGFPFRAIRPKSGSDHQTGEHLGHKNPRTLERFYRLKPKEVDSL
ncbi:MAG: tyrosine-type recombinase/integrase [Xanthomonadales bacterium]|nr:tyrosine-type recombinase/integrase [Xanthomonadales bacterium]